MIMRMVIILLSVARVVVLTEVRLFGIIHRMLLGLVRGVFDDFIEFASIQPNSPTLWAIVNFHPPSLRHLEIGLINWAFHIVSFVNFSAISFLAHQGEAQKRREIIFLRILARYEGMLPYTARWTSRAPKAVKLDRLPGYFICGHTVPVNKSG